jgi:hypothetical protein
VLDEAVEEAADTPVDADTEVSEDEAGNEEN